MSNQNEAIRRRALGAVLRNAVFSWQSLLTVGVTAVLYAVVRDPFVFWQPWFWLVGGAAAEVAWIISCITDPEMASEAVAKEFERKFDLRKIENRVSRDQLRSALEYRENMLQLVKQHRGAMRMSLRQTVDDIDDWIGHMYDLGLHIDNFESNELVERDRLAVPRQIEKTRQRIEIEKDPEVRQDLEGKLIQLEQQLTNLNATANSAKRATIQMESTLASLGTVYAQMARLGTKDVDSARAQRLRLEIQDEVASLQDTIEAMDEVQSQSLRLS